MTWICRLLLFCIALELPVVAFFAQQVVVSSEASVSLLGGGLTKVNGERPECVLATEFSYCAGEDNPGDCVPELEYLAMKESLRLS